MTDEPPAPAMLDLPGCLEVSAPATLATIDIVQDLFRHLWAQHDDIDAATRMRVEVAAVEVLTNIVEHAFALDTAARVTEQRRITSALVVADGEVQVSFCDNGLPAELDLSRVTLPDDDMAESGRGLAMALASVDELSYDRAGGRNFWRLRCRV